MDPRPWFDRPSPRSALNDAELNALAPPTILVVEDDGDILELLVLLFEQAGFSCVASRTAEEGLEQLREEQFDLVLADYSLPNRSAAWMLGHARDEGLLLATPVLIATAHPEPPGVGEFEIVRKPFDLDRLVERVKQRLERGSPRPRAVRGARKAAPAGSDGRQHSNHHGRQPIELILYISAHSPRSLTAVDNLKRALAAYESSRVKLTIYDLASDPSRGVTDSVAFTPTLVKRSPGPRTFILGHLSNPDIVLELLEGCES